MHHHPINTTLEQHYLTLIMITQCMEMIGRTATELAVNGRTWEYLCFHGLNNIVTLTGKGNLKAQRRLHMEHSRTSLNCAMRLPAKTFSFQIFATINRNKKKKSNLHDHYMGTSGNSIIITTTT